jgi:uncharacterized alkaline shock family protein YloU
VPDRSPPGRSLATRRAIADVVRSAVLTSYGVTRLEGRAFAGRLLARLGLVRPGIRVRLDRGLEIDLFVRVGYGLPIAEVARQIDSGVRYAVRRAFGVEVRRLTVHVGGLRYQPASVPPTRDGAREDGAQAARADGVAGPSTDGADPVSREPGDPGELASAAVPAGTPGTNGADAGSRSSPGRRRRARRPAEDAD